MDRVVVFGHLAATATATCHMIRDAPVAETTHFLMGVVRGSGTSTRRRSVAIGRIGSDLINSMVPVEVGRALASASAADLDAVFPAPAGSHGRGTMP